MGEESSTRVPLQDLPHPARSDHRDGSGLTANEEEQASSCEIDIALPDSCGKEAIPTTPPKPSLSRSTSKNRFCDINNRTPNYPLARNISTSGNANSTRSTSRPQPHPLTTEETTTINSTLPNGATFNTPTGGMPTYPDKLVPCAASFDPVNTPRDVTMPSEANQFTDSSCGLYLLAPRTTAPHVEYIIHRTKTPLKDKPGDVLNDDYSRHEYISSERSSIPYTTSSTSGTTISSSSTRTIGMTFEAPFERTDTDVSPTASSGNDEIPRPPLLDADIFI